MVAAGAGVVAGAVARCAAGALVTVEEGPIGDPPYAPSPAEFERMRTAVPKRRREFYTGRHLATVACARLGLARPELSPDERGTPRWPPGMVGSITHCDSWAAAAVAALPTVAALGVDVEPAEPLPAGLDTVVGGPREREWLADLPAALCPDRLLFCAKEAVFKAWYPLTLQWLDFEDVEVRLGYDGTWVARGGRGETHLDWVGAWSAVGGLVAAALVVPG